MLVGHNPGLEDLVAYLAEGELDIPDDGKVLPTSALAQLEVFADWPKLTRGCATLVSVTRPGQVPDDLLAEDDEEDDPEDQDGESRPVPDYFYTQSAVLPYRLLDGKLQIMLIASRKATRWVIPKGVKEPELSLRDSADKEALEEAGIRGKLDDEADRRLQLQEMGWRLQRRGLPDGRTAKAFPKKSGRRAIASGAGWSRKRPSA
jgi:phosphohistidine phosphatase